MENITFEQIPAAISKLLEKVSNLEKQLQVSASQNSESDRWLDLDELCNYDPNRPAKPTVYSYVHNRSIPFHKRGKKLFFLKSEIDLWLKSGRRKTTSEIHQESEQYVIDSSKNK